MVMHEESRADARKEAESLKKKDKRDNKVATKQTLRLDEDAAEWFRPLDPGGMSCLT